MIVVLSYMQTAISFADSALNWWVLATIISIIAFFISLSKGSFLRNGLINLFVGMPAAIWMLALQGNVTSGGDIPLYLSISLILGHLGVAIANFLVTPTSSPNGEPDRKRRAGSRG